MRFFFPHSVFHFGKLFSLTMALVHNDLASFDKTSVHYMYYQSDIRI